MSDAYITGGFPVPEGRKLESPRGDVDPVSPGDAAVEAFVVRDGWVVYLRPVDAEPQGTSVAVGEDGGRRVRERRTALPQPQ